MYISKEPDSLRTLLEIDPFGELTASMKAALPGYFRVVPKGTKPAGPHPDDSREAPPAAEPAASVAEGLKDLYRTDPIAKEFVDYIARCADTVAADHQDGTAAANERAAAGVRFLQELRAVADEFLTLGNSVVSLVHAGEAWGRYDGCLEAIRKAAEVVEVQVDEEGLATGLRIQDVHSLTEPQQRLLVDAGRALTVVEVVLQNRERGSIPRARFARGDSAHAPAKSPAIDRRRKTDHYIRRLALIARSALRDTSASYARLSLDAFRDDFVAMEADTVKHQYVRVLGQRCLVFGAIFLLLWILAVAFFPDHTISPYAAPFLMAAVGACAGTWLSFAIRRVVLQFNDLALLEDDRMHPTARVLFVIGLTWLVGLFLQSGIVNAELNEVRLDLATSGMVALLIGAMCGIAERALAGAVGKRSEDFASRIGTLPATPATSTRP